MLADRFQHDLNSKFLENILLYFTCSQLMASFLPSLHWSVQQDVPLLKYIDMYFCLFWRMCFYFNGHAFKEIHFDLKWWNIKFLRSLLYVPLLWAVRVPFKWKKLLKAILKCYMLPHCHLICCIIIKISVHFYNLTFMAFMCYKNYYTTFLHRTECY